MRVVGADDEAVALVVHPVFVSRPARGYQRWLDHRLRRWYKPLLRGNVVARADDDVLLRRGERQAHEEAWIGLLVDYGVAFDGFAECVQAYLVWAPVLVQHHVEERRVPGVPHDRSGGVLDSVSKQIVSGQILDCYRVSLRAVGVGTVGEQSAVVAHRHRPKSKVLEAFRQRRFIQDRLSSVGRRLPRVQVVGGPALPDAILASFPVAPLVVPLATLPGHA